MPRDLFDALAAGGGGLPAARRLTTAERSRHIILLRGVLAAGRDAGREQARLTRSGYDLLTEVQRRNPAAAEAVIGYPAVGAWARRTLLSSGGGPPRPGAEPGQLSAVAAAAAIRARVPAEIEAPVTAGRVMLPALGAAASETTDAPAAIVRTGPDVTEIRVGGRTIHVPADPSQDAPGWQGLRRVHAEALDVLVDDLDPFRMPDSEQLSGRLSAAETGEFAASLLGAWQELQIRHPAVAEEIAALVTVVVPYRVPPHGQVSATAAENFGAIAMSPSDDPSACAAILAHEVQHLKLCALVDIVALTLPDGDHRYYAPWRPDPRPISSLLQGAYAFLGVSAFWRRQRQDAEGDARLRADTEFARWRAAAARVADTLWASDRLTPDGRDFVRHMRQTLSRWQDEPVLPEAGILAGDAAGLHEARWALDNGSLPAK